MYKSRNERMFRITALSCLLLVCLLMMGCTTQQSKLEDGLYLAKWEGYTGITTDEEAIAYIPIMSVGTGKEYEYPQQYTRAAFNVVMDGEPTSENAWIYWPTKVIQTYGTNRQYKFSYLTVQLSNLTEGTHEITSVKVAGTKNNFVFPVHWIIEVREPSDATPCLKVEERSWDPVFLDPTTIFGLRNTCSTEAIVDGVSPTGTDLDAKMYLFPVAATSSTSTVNTNRRGPYQQVTIAPNSVEAVIFTFSPKSPDKELAPFTQFNPLVIYRVSGDSSEQFIAPTKPEVSTWAPEDEEAFKATVQQFSIKGIEVDYP